jgi:hypothetical protein
MSRRIALWATVAVVALAASGSAQQMGELPAQALAARKAHVKQNMQGAERVVVGRVASLEPAWKTNEFGDQLIVSRTWVVSDETLKGEAGGDVPVEIEGGTIGGLTLTVSDLPELKPGDRAVFMLKRNKNGEFIPQGRGNGVLKVRDGDIVEGLDLPLDEVRSLAREIR